MAGTLDPLHGLYLGETCHIVGRGPSLLHLTPADFGPGPVITLNLAILTIRTLALPNPIYAMQKDGCIQYDGRAPKPGAPGHICVWPLTPPIEPETLLVSTIESPNCYGDYPRRFLFDPEPDFGLPWHTPSAPCAVKLAAYMGCTSLVMLCHDAYTRGDGRTVEPQGIVDYHDAGYLQAGRLADRLAREAGLAIEWR